MFFNSPKNFFYKFVFTVSFVCIVISSCSQLSIITLSASDYVTFDNDNQGWQISSGASGSYSPTGGNPSGYIIGIDIERNVWYFIASPVFIKEVTKGYAKTLHFDLIQSAIDAQYDGDDVILTDGKNTLTFDTAYNPKTTWTHYSVKLDEFSGWKKGKVNATKADMQAVLQNLTDLRIRGEFIAGPDQGGLDNVTIY